MGGLLYSCGSNSVQWCLATLWFFAYSEHPVGTRVQASPMWNYINGYKFASNYNCSEMLYFRATRYAGFGVTNGTAVTEHIDSATIRWI